MTGRQTNTKATIFNGNISKFRVRSGSDGIKNIYLDFYDANENIASIAFISDSGKAISFVINGKELWSVKV